MVASAQRHGHFGAQRHRPREWAHASRCDARSEPGTPAKTPSHVGDLLARRANTARRGRPPGRRLRRRTASDRAPVPRLTPAGTESTRLLVRPAVRSRAMSLPVRYSPETSCGPARPAADRPERPRPSRRLSSWRGRARAAAPSRGRSLRDRCARPRSRAISSCSSSARP